ncbi:MAG: hypothetical protein GYB36_03545 [Alphaproteobacteria bacterium]|nr:hypothetical protein [Alphaproteobacteria bacterium]
MGRAFFEPVDQPVRRRFAAAAVSLCANALLIALLLFAPRHTPEAPEIQAVEVILFTDTSQPEPEIETDPIPEPETTEPEQAEIVEVLVAQDETPPEPDQTDTIPPPPAITADELVEDEDVALDGATSSDEAVALQAFNGEALPLPPGRSATGRVMRQLFCLNSSEATREAGNCPEGPNPDGSFFLRHASNENLARARSAFDLTPGQMRTAFGNGSPFPLNDLSGQGAMSNQHSQATSSADSMRDSLPAQHPDPAFGD